jgi:hypothetical protein
MLAGASPTGSPTRTCADTVERYIEMVDALAPALANHAEAEDDRGSLAASFGASVHSVTIHPHGPREGFEMRSKVNLPPSSEGRCFPKQSVVGDTW